MLFMLACLRSLWPVEWGGHQTVIYVVIHDLNTKKIILSTRPWIGTNIANPQTFKKAEGSGIEHSPSLFLQGVR